MTYVFGIDGGGTRSRMRIADRDGRLLYHAECDSTNIYSVGVETAQKNLRTLVERACAGAEVNPVQFDAGCFGSAGLDRHAECELFARFFRDSLTIACPLKLCNDGEILLVGKLRARQGYCLIGGTGSIALARSESGELIRAGGLGYMLGDEGAASWIGWQAIKRALRSLERRDLPTGMLPALLESFALRKPVDFVPMMHHRFQKAQVAAVTPLVTGFAERGDALAADICRQAVDELFMLIQSVVERMPLAGGIALAGGVLENSALIREPLQRCLAEAYPEHPVVLDGGTALDGAYMLALEKLEEAQREQLE